MTGRPGKINVLISRRHLELIELALTVVIDRGLVPREDHPDVASILTEIRQYLDYLNERDLADAIEPSETELPEPTDQGPSG